MRVNSNSSLPPFSLLAEELVCVCFFFPLKWVMFYIMIVMENR